MKGNNDLFAMRVGIICLVALIVLCVVGTFLFDNNSNDVLTELSEDEIATIEDQLDSEMPVAMYYYTNYAWKYTCGGYFIYPDGSAKFFNLPENQKDVISSPNILYEYLKNNEIDLDLACEIDAEKVLNCYGRLEEIKNNGFTDKNVRVDGGTTILCLLEYTGVGESIKCVSIYSFGDNEGISENKYAAAFAKYITGIPEMQKGVGY